MYVLQATLEAYKVPSNFFIQEAGYCSDPGDQTRDLSFGLLELYYQSSSSYYWNVNILYKNHSIYLVLFGQSVDEVVCSSVVNVWYKNGRILRNTGLGIFINWNLNNIVTCTLSLQHRGKPEMFNWGSFTGAITFARDKLFQSFPLILHL